MKINQIKAGVILSYVSMFLGILISLVYTPIILRMLGQSEYGLYSLVASVVGYLNLLNFGLSSAYMRYYSRYKVTEGRDKIASLNGMFLMVFSLLGMVVLVVGAGLIGNSARIFAANLTVAEIEKARVLMAIMVFNLAFSLPASVFTSNITANEKYFFLRMVNIIKIVVSPLLTLPILMLGYQALGMVVMTTLCTMIAEIINIFFCFKKLQMEIAFNRFEFGLIKEVAYFSFFIFLNMIVDQINWSVDKFILGVYQGTVAVAIYGVAAQLNTYYINFASNFAAVFTPRIHRLVTQQHNNDELTALFTRVGRIQFIILSFICLCLIFFGKSFICLWAGADYRDSYYIALLLIIPVTVSLVQTIGIEIQRAQNLHQYRAVIYIIIAIINLGISIPLCKLWSGIGCAMGTSLGIICGNGIAMNIVYHQKCGINMIYFWRQILKFIPALIIPLIIGILLVKWVNLNNWMLFLGCGLVYLLVYAASMWYLGMNQYEKELISKPTQYFHKFKSIKDV